MFWYSILVSYKITDCAKCPKQDTTEIAFPNLKREGGTAEIIPVLTLTWLIKKPVREEQWSLTKEA